MGTNDAAHKQYNVRLPRELADEVKAEAHRLTEHRSRGFSDLIAIFARYGWEAYQKGDLEIKREPQVVSYRLIRDR